MSLAMDNLNAVIIERLLLNPTPYPLNPGSYAAGNRHRKYQHVTRRL